MCSDLLNCLRSVSTIIITTGSGWNRLKVIFTQQFLTKATIFCCFDVYAVRPFQIFQVQAKISTIRPCFQTIFPFLMIMFLAKLQNFLAPCFLNSALHIIYAFYVSFYKNLLLIWHRNCEISSQIELRVVICDILWNCTLHNIKSSVITCTCTSSVITCIGTSKKPPVLPCCITTFIFLLRK